jgi:dipeptidyl aminopeptidase/acylaminoacyl peptidase
VDREGLIATKYNQDQKMAVNEDLIVEKTVLSAADIVLGDRIAEACSKESFVLYTLKTIDKESKKASVNLWLHNANGNGMTQLTRSSEGVGNPVLAVNLPGADNQAMYLKSGQIWTIPLDGGESAQVTKFDFGIDTFKVFRGPENKVFVACTINVYPDMSPSETLAADKVKEEDGSGMVFDQLLVRHWDTWNCYEKRSHVFVAPLNIGSSGLFDLPKDDPQHQLVDLMAGLHTDCPGKPFGGTEDYDVHPEGSEIVIACRAFEEDGKQKRDMAWSTDVKLYTVAVPGVEGAKTGLQCISNPADKGWHGCPSYSPDGAKIAYLRMDRAKYESDQTYLWMCDRASGKLSNVSAAFDLSLGGATWLDDSSFFTTAQHQGSIRVFRFNLDSDRSSLVQTDFAVMAGDESRSCPMIASTSNPLTKQKEQRLYFFESSLSKPNELRAINLSRPGDGKAWTLAPALAKEQPEGFEALVGNASTSLTTFATPCPSFTNGDLIMPVVQQFRFNARNEDGTVNSNPADRVHCFYLPPVSMQCAQDEQDAAAGTVPLVLIVHGGPQGAFLNAWNYRWNLSYYAALGYGVVCVNFHGSTSYGQKYVDSIRNDWGGQPYRDVMEGVRWILEKKTYLNKDKVGAAGASYGGFMMNWIAGHADPGHFKCLVNHDGIFSLRNLYYTTEELYFPEYEFGLPPMLAKSKECADQGDQDIAPGQYDRWDPANFIDKWCTPHAGHSRGPGLSRGRGGGDCHVHGSTAQGHRVQAIVFPR